MAERKPFPKDPEEFHKDERITLDDATFTYRLAEETGEEWTFDEQVNKWISLTDEALVKQQQSIYLKPGVDENEPAMDPKKRKAGKEGTNGKAKKLKPEKKTIPRKNTAIYVTSLPDDVDEDELEDAFSRFGVIAESAETNNPRIKLYTDENGEFKGDALIVYFRPESVNLAINLLDETDFRPGEPAMTGPMRVTEADSSYKSQKDQPLTTDEAKKKGTKAHRDRQNAINKTQEMNNRLADWSDEDLEHLPKISTRWDKTVVIKHMFTLEEMKTDPQAADDIKEELLDQCSKYGDVNHVVIYDREVEGIATVRFANAKSASRAASAFNDREFDGRKLKTYIAAGKEKFEKSRKKYVAPGSEKKRVDAVVDPIERKDT